MDRTGTTCLADPSFLAQIPKVIIEYDLCIKDILATVNQMISFEPLSANLTCANTLLLYVSSHWRQRAARILCIL